MATIRKHRDKWQVRIRRAGLRPISKSFAVRRDAMEWGRQMEVKADRADLPTDPKALERVTLGDLVRRYIDTVTRRDLLRMARWQLLHQLGHSSYYLEALGWNGISVRK